MAERNPIYQCPCCNGNFTIIDGKLFAVYQRGEYTEVRDDGSVVECHQSAPGRSAGGVRVETAIDGPRGTATQHRKRGGDMQPLGDLGATRPPTIKDRRVQAALEADRVERGFPKS